MAIRLLDFRGTGVLKLVTAGLMVFGLSLAGPSVWGFDDDDDDDEIMPMVEADFIEERFEPPAELQPPEEMPARPRARPRRRGVPGGDDMDSDRAGVPPPPPPPAFNRASESRQPPRGRFGSSNRANTSRSSNIKFKATGEKRKYPPRPKSQATRNSQGK